MIGNIIYLIYCKYQNGDEVLQTPHATFDGTLEHMNQIKKYWECEKGFDITEVPDGSFYVNGPFGFQRLYYVVTRTIEK